MIDYCNDGNRQQDCGRALRPEGGNPAGRDMNCLAMLRRNMRQLGFIAAVLVVGACGSDEPPFPPTANGPNITSLPEGLGSDSANAQYSDQALEPPTESAPRPEPAPPPAPKAAETETAPEAAPAGEAQPSGSEAPAAAAPAESAPAETPAPSPAPAASNNGSSYPDINTVPMERPTPEQNMEPDAPPADQAPAGQAPTGQAPADQPPAGDMSSGSPQSFNAGPAAAGRLAATDEAELTIITAAGDVDAAESDPALTQPDAMFTQPSLPPYTKYEDAQKRAQSLYHSPYSNGALSTTAAGGPLILSGTSSSRGSGAPGATAIYASQPDANSWGGNPSAVTFSAEAAGQPVGLIYFANGSARLSAEDRRILKQVAQMQKSYGGVIRVVGHASSRTEDMPLDRHYKANADMSQARAQSVAAYLVRLGVDANVVQVAGVSDSRPVYPEFMPSGEAANRRAEIYLSSY